MLNHSFWAIVWLINPFQLRPESDDTRRWVSYFLEERTATTTDALHNARHYAREFRDIFRQQGLPEDLIWIAFVESGFRGDAVNNSGATGMFQFKRGTALAFGLKVNHTVDERLDPIASAKAAARYLVYLKEKFATWELVLAAYNLGEGDLRRTMARQQATHWNQVKHLVRQQTQDYADKIRAAALIGNDFLHAHPLPAGTSSVYLVKKGDTLFGISKRFKVPLSQIMELNHMKDHHLRPGRHLLLPARSP